jgi:hypothetical protein
MIQNTRVAEIQISYTPAIAEKPIITGSFDAYNALTPFFPTSTIALQEQFVCMYSNARVRVHTYNGSPSTLSKTDGGKSNQQYRPHVHVHAYIVLPSKLSNISSSNPRNAEATDGEFPLLQSRKQHLICMYVCMCVCMHGFSG